MTQEKAILATRGSMLAMWQANFISRLLQDEGLATELLVVKTTGDTVQDRFLHEIGGKGLFIKELEEAMLNNIADFAMHSLKDLPVKIPEGFCLPAVLKRHSHCDVMIFKKSFYAHLNLPEKATLGAEQIRSLGPMRIATSSLRRQALLEQLNSGISVQPIRGNVDTRLKKLEDQDWHALILAEASLDRLGIKDIPYHRLDPHWFVPCAGQGALAIETKSSSKFIPTLSKLNCLETWSQVHIEREILRALGGDCTMPFGCLVQDDLRTHGNILGRVVVLDLDGNSVTAIHSISKSQLSGGQPLVDILLKKLEDAGVAKILKTLGLSHKYNPSIS